MSDLNDAKKQISGKYLLNSNGRNIVGVGIGFKVSEHYNDRSTGTLCVRIYVSDKPSKESLVPVPISDALSQVGIDVLTDVINVGRPFAPRRGGMKPWLRRPGDRPGAGSSIAPGGAKAGNVDSLVGGTLGAVLYGSKAGQPIQKYILSCNHVLAVNERISPLNPIVSPAPEDQPGEGEIIAKYVAAIRIERNMDRPGRLMEDNHMDCALAEVTGEVDARLPMSMRPEDLTKVNAEAVAPELGQPVVKFGKTTGFTTGTVVDVHADILVDYSFGTFKFIDQVLIRGDDGKDFADDGDSGSVVWVVRDGLPSAVAMLYGPLGKYTAACPMVEVIQGLEYKLGDNTKLTFSY